MTVLFIAHTDEAGTLPKAALEALSAAKTLATDLSQPLNVGLVGSDITAAMDSIGGCGAEKFFAVSGEAFGQSRYATDAAAFEAICKAADASAIIAPATSRTSRALPGVAYRLDGRIDTNLTGLAARDGKPVATRWFYRQRMSGEVIRETTPWIMTISAGCFEAIDASGSASIESLDVGVDGLTRTDMGSVEGACKGDQTIRPDAEVLFVAGAGWTKKQADGQPHVNEAGDLILDFLGKAQASLGSSKSLVDIGGEGQDVLPFLTHLHQVGQTGSTPRHAKGLATCCHGEEPHVVGWRFVNERRAINLDAGCGWSHGKADVLYIADAFEVMTKVNELLKD